MKKNMKGFTLIELMIVVAIIGILAAVAIPNFRNYQLKAKESEVKVNLGAIGVAQESYYAEYDEYVDCSDYPGQATTASTKQTWTDSSAGSFNSIGFAPKDNNVYFSYEVDRSGSLGSTSAYVAYGRGDLDDSSATGDNVWEVSNITAVRKTSSKSAY